MKKVLVCMALLLVSANIRAAEMDLADFALKELSVRQADDVASLKTYRTGLFSILEYVSDRPDLFPKKPMNRTPVLTADLRNDAVNIWNRLMDYYLALGSVYALHKDFGKVKNGKLKETSFHISRAALYMEYRIALDFIALSENNPALDAVFNEPVPELGLPDGTYADFKYRFLNVVKAGEFAAFEALASFFGSSDGENLSQWITEDRSRIWEAGKGQGPLLTIKNALAIFNNTGRKAFLPVQKGVAGWMGRTKVHRSHSSLITQEQIKILQHFLQPGDLLLERREWYLSNVGLPGFWTHVALYVGSPEQREAYFVDPATIVWVQKQGVKRFEELLQKTHPMAYQRSMETREGGYRLRVIEAIAEGVTFTTLEFSAACDSLAILRPKVPKKDKAVAILRAFEYSGRPYDYNFDFLTDNTLVCTEVIYKAYQPGSETAGLELPLEKIMGRVLLSPNSIVRFFAESYDKADRPMDLVLFLDGYEKEVIAMQSNLSSFLESWKRPKWHILVQGIPDSP